MKLPLPVVGHLSISFFPKDRRVHAFHPKMTPNHNHIDDAEPIGLKGCLRHDGGESSSSSIDQATARRSRCASPPPSSHDDDDDSTSTASSSRHRRRRVCFIDDNSKSNLPHQVVTRVHFRPKTQPDEKRALFYSRRDFALFALEHQYEKVDLLRRHNRDIEKFGWEDCMTVESFDGDGDEIRFDSDAACRNNLHKVKTLADLKFAYV